jgi:hypothetical protein
VQTQCVRKLRINNEQKLQLAKKKLKKKKKKIAKQCLIKFEKEAILASFYLPVWQRIWLY